MALIQFLTCESLEGFFPSEDYPQLTADDAILFDELKSRGHDARILVWTSEEARAPEGDMILIRTPWDYFERRDEMSGWLDAMEAGGYPLENPARLVRWNLQKTYLLDLAARGAAVIPTRTLARGAHFDLAEMQAHFSTDEIVIKPVIGANAYMTFRVNDNNINELRPQIERLTEQQDALVQPFLAEILSDGEWSLVFFDGQFSHGFLKKGAPGDFRIHEEHGGSTHVVPIPDEIIPVTTRAVELAGQASGLEEPALYARADGVRTKDGFLIMELEMFEPELYFRGGDDIAPRFADILEKRLAAKA